MTEKKWLASEILHPMLQYLRDLDVASDRKFRLFAAACCRGAWRHLADDRSKQAVEAAELAGKSLNAWAEEVLGKAAG